MTSASPMALSIMNTNVVSKCMSPAWTSPLNYKLRSDFLFQISTWMPHGNFKFNVSNPAPDLLPQLVPVALWQWGSIRELQSLWVTWNNVFCIVIRPHTIAGEAREVKVGKAGEKALIRWRSLWRTVASASGGEPETTGGPQSRQSGRKPGHKARTSRSQWRQSHVCLSLPRTLTIRVPGCPLSRSCTCIWPGTQRSWRRRSDGSWRSCGPSSCLPPHPAPNTGSRRSPTVGGARSDAWLPALTFRTQRLLLRFCLADLMDISLLVSPNPEPHREENPRKYDLSPAKLEHSSPSQFMATPGQTPWTILDCSLFSSLHPICQCTHWALSSKYPQNPATSCQSTAELSC